MDFLWLNSELGKCWSVCVDQVHWFGYLVMSIADNWWTVCWVHESNHYLLIVDKSTPLFGPRCPCNLLEDWIKVKWKRGDVACHSIQLPLQFSQLKALDFLNSTTHRHPKVTTILLNILSSLNVCTIYYVGMASGQHDNIFLVAALHIVVVIGGWLYSSVFLFC